jgi:hypothetical protein
MITTDHTIFKATPPQAIIHQFKLNWVFWFMCCARCITIIGHLFNFEFNVRKDKQHQKCNAIKSVCIALMIMNYISVKYCGATMLDNNYCHGAGKRDREFYSFHTHNISTS